MLDVLEHTFDPAMVLTNLAELLRSGGCIIASVPNIGCVWDATILAGRFPSAQCGLFDFGHIRWFTKSSLMRLICGMKQFVLSDWQGTTIPAVSKMGLWRTERLQTWLLKLLARHWSSMWGYQLVFRIDLYLPKNNMRFLVSIVIPCYKGEASPKLFVVVLNNLMGILKLWLTTPALTDAVK